MAVLINPGSENKGGTIKQARVIAKHWLKSIHEDGMKEVTVNEGERLEDGDFKFIFTHQVTGKTATLVTHGYTDKELKQFVFNPRVYWNGSSTGNPEIEDFLAEGYSYRIEFFKS